MKVECITLENIFDENRITNCDLLKLDCEGAEYDILMNTKKEIFEKIKLISLEYHNIINHDGYELKKFLEIVGFLVAVFLLPFKFKFIISSFILFRFFDCWKPFPIRRVEKLKGGWGVMLDDLLAGVYTNIILQIYRLIAR